ncbi:trehalose-phosphatase [Larsenimonas rhizosphaerae]|uniref:trehalose-phosphatase n=1 Tax=Larsenimonas rhizosphaerae TaxID=2944682 RepID=UPI00203446BB|nr:trehalose-phosphatase [Larsenimonas rhizosphaerae]MCM2130662.1 trehalose-phosphatase [Larsenimonas rhizosphaerae]
MSAPERLSPPPLSPDRHWALFLDVDGTLTPLMDRPEDVRLTEDVISLIERLDQRLQGALAVVSGRAIDNLTPLLSPLDIAMAGQHGAERRDQYGYHQADVPESLIDHVRDALHEFAEQHDGISIEHKGGSLALHYRNAPDLYDRAREYIDNLLAGCDKQMTAHEGKCVIELRTSSDHKGDAIRAFMEKPPFAGRIPVFLGDDVTDEDGFGTVTELDGLTIKVGDGPTCAIYWLEGPEQVAQWLSDSLDSLKEA